MSAKDSLKQEKARVSDRWMNSNCAISILYIIILLIGFFAFFQSEDLQRQVDIVSKELLKSKQGVLPPLTVYWDVQQCHNIYVEDFQY